MAREKPDYVIVPKKTIISNPAVNYGQPKEPVKRWIGEVTSWERRVRFGREMPIPWQKEYECKADNPEMARFMLGRLAQRDGYALGGIQDIRQEDAE
jgi:hypothetical protein